jgi:hypothetical protein
VWKKIKSFFTRGEKKIVTEGREFDKMFHYTVRCMGSITGGVFSDSEQEALDLVAKANGFKDFAEELLRKKLKRDHYSVEERSIDKI